MSEPQILWERSESKLVRPFRSADGCLADASIRLYFDDDFVSDAIITREQIDVERLNIALRIPAAPNDLAQTVGLPLSALRLIISVEDRTLKKNIVVKTLALKDIDGAPIELDEEARSLVGWKNETRLSLAIILAEDRKSQPGIAKRAGSWLSKKTFSISRIRDNPGLNLRPVDEAWFKAHGLPTDTTYYVELLDNDLNQTYEDLPEIVNVYVNVAAMAALSKEEHSAAGRAIVRAMYADIVSTVLVAGYSSLKGAITKGSVLEMVANRLTRSTGVSEKRLREFATRNGGAKLRCVVQSDAELTQAIAAASSRRHS